MRNIQQKWKKKVIAPPAAQEGSQSAKYGNRTPAARGIARMLRIARGIARIPHCKHKFNLIQAKLISMRDQLL
jgi:hypothetical protein